MYLYINFLQIRARRLRTLAKSSSSSNASANEIAASTNTQNAAEGECKTIKKENENCF